MQVNLELLLRVFGCVSCTVFTSDCLAMFRYSRLKPVDDGPYTAIKFQSKDPAHALSVRNTRVFLAHMVDEHGEELSTILKTGTNACIQTEVHTFSLLSERSIVLTPTQTLPYNLNCSAPAFPPERFLL